MSDVRYGKESEQLVGDRVEEFKGNLSRVTRRFARHERAQTIDVRHVENAYEALVRCGLERMPWWQRPQMKLTLSGFFVAAALATPDFAPYFSNGNEKTQAILFWTGISVFSLCAVGMYVWGWLQNRI